MWILRRLIMMMIMGVIGFALRLYMLGELTETAQATEFGTPISRDDGAGGASSGGIMAQVAPYAAVLAAAVAKVGTGDGTGGEMQADHAPAAPSRLPQIGIGGGAKRVKARVPGQTRNRPAATQQIDMQQQAAAVAEAMKAIKAGRY